MSEVKRGAQVPPSSRSLSLYLAQAAADQVASREGDAGELSARLDCVIQRRRNRENVTKASAKEIRHLAIRIECIESRFKLHASASPIATVS